MNLRATEMTRLRLWTTSCSCARLSPLRARRVTLSSVSRSNGGWALISLISGARSSNSLRSRISLRSFLSPCAAYNARALPTIPPLEDPEPPFTHETSLGCTTPGSVADFLSRRYDASFTRGRRSALAQRRENVADFPTQPIQASRKGLVRGLLCLSHPRAGARVASHLVGEEHTAPRADWVGQDACGLSDRDRPADVHAAAAKRCAVSDPLRFAAKSAGGRCREEPARAPGRHRGAGGADGRLLPPSTSKHPHRRYSGERAGADGPRAARHPHHPPR